MNGKNANIENSSIKIIVHQLNSSVNYHAVFWKQTWFSIEWCLILLLFNLSCQIVFCFYPPAINCIAFKIKTFFFASSSLNFKCHVIGNMIIYYIILQLGSYKQKYVYIRVNVQVKVSAG